MFTCCFSVQHNHLTKFKDASDNACSEADWEDCLRALLLCDNPTGDVEAIARTSDDGYLFIEVRKNVPGHTVCNPRARSLDALTQPPGPSPSPQPDKLGRTGKRKADARATRRKSLASSSCVGATRPWAPSIFSTGVPRPSVPGASSRRRSSSSGASTTTFRSSLPRRRLAS